jgi:hypothetical protein
LVQFVYNFRVAPISHKLKKVGDYGRNKAFIVSKPGFEISDYIKMFSCAAIAGFGDENSYREKNKEIIIYLKDRGYLVFFVRHSYVGSTEVAIQGGGDKFSFFVVNDKFDGDDRGRLEIDLAKLACKYGRDSIISISAGGKKTILLGTGYRQGASLEHNQAVDISGYKYNSDARKYIRRIESQDLASEDVQEIDFPGTVNGRWGWSLLAKEIEKGLGR